MRRDDKQITDKSLIEEILSTNKVCRIALASKNEPYIVSMFYGYANGCLYLHSAREGKKLDIIKENSRVCFEISDSIEIIQSETPCGFSTRYRSIIGQGKISVLTNEHEKRSGLSVLMNQNTSKSDWNIPTDEIEKIAVLKIQIESITGKKSN
jgi:nitroimidazol reductase NimA-like FMN-containing flavoprotein (pyridoxamine 5'-phosphate oxidase superfamily)